MTAQMTARPAGKHAERYRRTEQALWRHHGIEPPVERFVDLASPNGRVRVLDVGAGEPLLLVHGTVGPGGWASLVAALPDHRCLVLDRPGWGGSTPVDFSRAPYGETVSEVVRGVLDALDLDRVAVVGGSIGNVWALRLAALHPSRVGRVVLLGAGPIRSDARVPGIIRLLASPAGAVMVRMPGNRSRVHSILRGSGHGPSLANGRIPDEFIDWRVSVERETDSMRHERDMVCAIVKGKSYRPGLTFADAELGAIRQPVLHVHGTADEAVGPAESWARVADALPHGELRLVDGAGHMPWFDELDTVAGEVKRFLTE